MKPEFEIKPTRVGTQPPSGGCVLKHRKRPAGRRTGRPAAFRRLCVETGSEESTAVIRTASRLQAAVC